MMTTTLTWNWFNLEQREQSICEASYVHSLKQILRNEFNFDGSLEEALGQFDVDRLILDELSSRRDLLTKQHSVFHRIDEEALEAYKDSARRATVLLAAKTLARLEPSGYIATLNRDFQLYRSIAMRSGIVYKEPSITGRVRSDILRVSLEERGKKILQRAGRDFKVVSIDYRGFEPNCCVTKIVDIFPRGSDVYSIIAEQDGIDRAEAKQLVLSKWLWGPVEDDRFKRFYDWRKQLYTSTIMAGRYRLPNGETYYLTEEDDERKLANHYVQGYASEIARSIAWTCVNKLKKSQSFLAAIVFDELMFAIHKDESAVIEDLRCLVESVGIPVKVIDLDI